MSEGRTLVLGRVRAALGRQAQTGSDAELPQPPTGPTGYTRPGIGPDLLGHFSAQLLAAAGTLTGVEAEDEIPAAVARYLTGQGLPARLAVAPALATLPWPADWEVRFGPSRGQDRVAVTPCFAAVAETGTLALLSGPESPTTLNFLPDHHLVVVRASQVVDHLERLWEWLRRRPEGMPRTVNLITGPSRTADVEQTLQLGAHGPLALHVILVRV